MNSGPERVWVTTTIVATAVVILTACGGNARPTERTMLNLTETELRSIVLSNTPVGTTRTDVEKALRQTFRKTWRVIDYEARPLLQQRFDGPVSNADYYFSSDFAKVRRNVWSTDIITVYLLFGPNHQLKEVAVSKWSDSI